MTKNNTEWALPGIDTLNLAKKLIQERTMPMHYAMILANRGLKSFKEAESFVAPSLDDMADPFLFKDMRKAVDRLKLALKNGEHIMIHGDYDVDGVCGTSIFMRIITGLGGKVSYYIPNRFREGYGVSIEGVNEAIKLGVTLIMTVDTGMTAFDEAKYAKSKGIDFIITDHHEPQSDAPEALAVINPKIANSGYPFRELAGVGVMFTLLQALYIDTDMNINDLYDELDLVALGTAADVVPLVDENRILTKFGIQRMRETGNTGIAALMEVSGSVKSNVNSNNIIHILAPRLNAPGRLSSASKTVDLLTSNNWLNALNIADEIEKENTARRQMNDQVNFEAEEMLINAGTKFGAGGIVLASKNWHQGVIGIAASRIVEKYNSPTILISLEDGIGKGSARSVKGFDICSAISECDDILENFGGHKYAVGLTINADKIDELKKRFNKILHRELPDGIPKSTINIDAEVELSALDDNLIRFLEKLSPYGESNPIPILLTRNLKPVGDSRIVGNNHLKFSVTDGYRAFDAIGFNLGKYKDRVRLNNSPIDILYNVEENVWRGRKNIQLVIKAIR
ncbi:single-stranded-DNA-specific exonuclease RecJ [Candidatus Latescibacterota bacterium]